MSSLTRKAFNSSLKLLSDRGLKKAAAYMSRYAKLADEISGEEEVENGKIVGFSDDAYDKLARLRLPTDVKKELQEKSFFGGLQIKTLDLGDLILLSQRKTPMESASVEPFKIQAAARMCVHADDAEDREHEQEMKKHIDELHEDIADIRKDGDDPSREEDLLKRTKESLSKLQQKMRGQTSAGYFTKDEARAAAVSAKKRVNGG